MIVTMETQTFVQRYSKISGVILFTVSVFAVFFGGALTTHAADLIFTNGPGPGTGNALQAPINSGIDRIVLFNRSRGDQTFVFQNSFTIDSIDIAQTLFDTGASVMQLSIDIESEHGDFITGSEVVSTRCLEYPFCSTRFTFKGRNHIVLNAGTPYRIILSYSALNPYSSGSFILASTENDPTLPWLDIYGSPDPSIEQLVQRELLRGNVLHPGEVVGTSSIAFSASLFSPIGRDVQLEVDLRPATGHPFPELPEEDEFITSNFVHSGETATVTAHNLSDGFYIWRARAVDREGLKSPWKEFSPDFFHFEVIRQYANSLYLQGGRVAYYSGFLAAFNDLDTSNCNGIIFSRCRDIFVSRASGKIKSAIVEYIGSSNNMPVHLEVIQDEHIIARSEPLTTECSVANCILRPAFQFIGDNQITLRPDITYTFRFIIDLDYRGGVWRVTSANFQNAVGGTEDVFFVLEGERPAAREPVIIVPGILGTEIFKGDQKLWLDLGKVLYNFGDEFMDPLRFTTALKPLDDSVSIGDVIRKEIDPILGLKVYDYIGNLIDLLRQQGYEDDKDLFVFPYDWRYGITGKDTNGEELNIRFLKHKIEQVIGGPSSSKKVNIIAHSTGGILVKKYITENFQNHHINKAVFVGVPNLGSPKAIKVFLQGDGLGVPGLNDGEIEKIIKNMPVAYDLTPSKKYAALAGSYVQVETSNNNIFEIKDLNYNQTVSFMLDDHQLNGTAQNNSERLRSDFFENYDIRSSGVDFYNIVGCKTATVGKIKELRRQNLVSYAAPDEISGDGTVPMISANSLLADSNHKFYAINADHGKMLSSDGIRQQIVNLVSGSTLPTGENIISQQDLDVDPNKCKLKGHWWQIFSPVSINVTDQHGNRAGIASDGSVENDIPGADYQVWGDHKFVFVPTDDEQVYRVNLQGTATGTFTFKAGEFLNNEIVKTEVFPNIAVTPMLNGNVVLNATSTLLALDLDGDHHVDQILPPTTILNPEQSQDLLAPQTAVKIIGAQGEQDPYKSNVMIQLLAQDRVSSSTSGVLVTKYLLDNQPDFQNYTVPFRVAQKGLHTIKYFSTDRAGNNEAEKMIKFTIK